VTDKRIFILAHDQARMGAMECIRTAPDGWAVTVQPPKKSRPLEEKYHAMIGDIADQTEYAGKRWDREDMKRIMIDEFADAMRKSGTPLHHDGRLIPSQDGTRVIQLGMQSRDFYKGEGRQFVEFLYAWGNELGVQWSEPIPPEWLETRKTLDRPKPLVIDADTGEIVT
jgi:hypothetical protein